MVSHTRKGGVLRALFDDAAFDRRDAAATAASRLTRAHELVNTFIPSAYLRLHHMLNNGLLYRPTEYQCL